MSTFFQRATITAGFAGLGVGIYGGVSALRSAALMSQFGYALPIFCFAIGALFLLRGLELAAKGEEPEDEEEIEDEEEYSEGRSP